MDQVRSGSPFALLTFTMTDMEASYSIQAKRFRDQSKDCQRKCIRGAHVTAMAEQGASCSAWMQYFEWPSSSESRIQVYNHMGRTYLHLLLCIWVAICS